jgi:hypothetical protein
MAEYDEHDDRPVPAFLAHRIKNGNGKGFFKSIEHRIDKLSPMALVLLAAGGVLVVEHLIAPKGMSLASKAIDKITGKAHALLPPPPPPPVIPPPAVIAQAAKGYFAGANQQAGWNRGMSPYGPWAVANPMFQYAHADQGHPWYEWE